MRKPTDLLGALRSEQARRVETTGPAEPKGIEIYYQDNTGTRYSYLVGDQYGPPSPLTLIITHPDGAQENLAEGEYTWSDDGKPLRTLAKTEPTN
jgi:hypothetical protein